MLFCHNLQKNQELHKPSGSIIQLWRKKSRILNIIIRENLNPKPNNKYIHIYTYLHIVIHTYPQIHIHIYKDKHIYKQIIGTSKINNLKTNITILKKHFLSI